MKRPITLALVLFVALCFRSSHAADPSTTPDLAAAQELAQQIHQGAIKGDLSMLAKAFDDVAVLDTAVQGLNVPADFRKGALSNSLGSQLSTGILQGIQAGGSYRLLRVRIVDGQPRALFRLVTNGGINYHDLHMVRSGNAIRIVDADIYLSGEPLTQTFRRIYMPMLADLNRGKLAKLAFGEGDFVKHTADIQKMQKEAQQGDANAALKIYDSLPESVRQNKAIMIIRFAAAARVGGDKYVEAMEAFEKQYPDDAGTAILSLDKLFIAKKYDEIAVMLNRLDKKLGGDPYLDHFRASAAIAQGKTAEAVVFEKRLITADPTLRDPYFVLINISVQQKDYDETTRLLTAAEKNAGVAWGKLDEVPAFADFCKSAAYAKWLKRNG